MLRCIGQTNWLIHLFLKSDENSYKNLNLQSLLMSDTNADIYINFSNSLFF